MQVSFLSEHILSCVVFSPLLLAVIVALIPTKLENAVRWVAFLGSAAIFLLSLVMYKSFDIGNAGLQMISQGTWLPQIGARYALGIDGISLYLVLLTTFLIPIIVLSAWHAVEKDIKKYLFFMFLLESTILGAFLALDLFLFYVFWEAMLIPMFFLIGIWGGKDKIYAAQKFLIYTFAGSVPMLVAIIYLVFQSKAQLGEYSAYLPDILKLQLAGGHMHTPQGLIFLAFTLAFAIKVPLFPLHTWLPDAHVQAPTGGSVILAGVLLKLGGYGLMRFAMPLSVSVLPIVSPWMMGIAAIAIVYGACVAIAQDDIKKLVAYSSVSHMGYVILGLFALNQIGITGSLYQMLNHGVSTGALFLLVGILYERKHTREITAYSGLAKTLPFFSIVWLIVTFSSIALPGTNGFIGEFLILQGSFLSHPLWTALAATGVILGAVYMLWLSQRILFGVPDAKKSEGLTDINWREFAYLVPLIFLIGYMGLFPKTFFRHMEPSIKEFTKRISTPTAPETALLRKAADYAQYN
ncbi:MAG: complex I subunit 4 family protein [Bdellovibrionota bacterium]